MKWNRPHPISCTGRLTAPTGHPVPCASATVPVTTGGRSLPCLAVLHLPVTAPRVGFILPCRSSWRSPPFLPPSRSPCSISRLFSTHSYAVAEPQPSEKLLAHPRVSVDRCCTRGPNRYAAPLLRRGLLPITGRPRPWIDRTDNPQASHRRGAPPRLVSLPPCSSDSATTDGSPSPECATVEDHTPVSFLAPMHPKSDPRAAHSL
jgi:hypothetical protein